MGISRLAIYRSNTFGMSQNNPSLHLKAFFDHYAHAYLFQQSYRLIKFLV